MSRTAKSHSRALNKSKTSKDLTPTKSPCGKKQARTQQERQQHYTRENPRAGRKNAGWRNKDMGRLPKNDRETCRKRRGNTSHAIRRRRRKNKNHTYRRRIARSMNTAEMPTARAPGPSVGDGAGVNGTPTAARGTPPGQDSMFGSGPLCSEDKSRRLAKEKLVKLTDLEFDCLERVGAPKSNPLLG